MSIEVTRIRSNDGEVGCISDARINDEGKLVILVTWNAGDNPMPSIHEHVFCYVPNWKGIETTGSLRGWSNLSESLPMLLINMRERLERS